MRLRMSLPKQLALELFAAIAQHFDIKLESEWFSKAYAAQPLPFVDLDLRGLPAALAQPETWKERIIIIYQKLAGKR